MALGAPVMLLIVLLAVVRDGLGANLLLGAIVGSLVVGLMRVRAGLDISDGGATVRGLVSQTVVPWSEVTNVDVSERGTRKLVVLETAKRFHRPVAPMSSRLLIDPQFEAKARQIADRWRANRPH